MFKLTEAQMRYLTKIVTTGEAHYNGRARKTLEALEAMGLVEYDFTLVPHMNMRFTELFTVRPTETGRRFIRNA